MWIQADIPYIGLTRIWCNAITPVIVYVNNDDTIPVNSMTSILNNLAKQRTLLQESMDGAEIVSKSRYQRLIIALLLNV